MPGCTKRYARPYDLARHLDAAHHSTLASASDTEILAAGVPPNQVARVRQLLGRRNACAVCGSMFSRRDALVRHLDEQGHRIVRPPAPVRGFEWALVPAREDASPGVMSPLDVLFDDAARAVPVPAAPLLRDADDFPFADADADGEAPLVFPGMPSLEDWEALINSWAREVSA